MIWHGSFLNDIFGKSRKRETRFADIETKAKELIDSLVKGKISDKDFAIAFDEVRTKFMKLTRVNGQITIDRDTPLWLNSFLGLHFVDWLRYQKVKWYFEEHPEGFSDERKKQFSEIQAMGYEERFMDKCKNVLKELSFLSR